MRQAKILHEKNCWNAIKRENQSRNHRPTNILKNQMRQAKVLHEKNCWKAIKRENEHFPEHFPECSFTFSGMFVSEKTVILPGYKGFFTAFNA